MKKYTDENNRTFYLLDCGEMHEHEAKVKDLEDRIKLLQNAIMKLSAKNNAAESFANDIELSLHDFMDIRDKHLSMEFEDDNCNIYGHDVTVHWSGFYCNCSDGAQAENYIIEGVRGLIEDEDFN